MTADELEVGIELTDRQREAATEPSVDVLVTAGAGTGKTRTLIGRYLWLLGQGHSPRDLAAITFTEKAGREMRNRVREAVSRLAGGDAERWAEFAAQMDAARIGTIHSLCSEILRAHPAEANVDPLFEVVDEGLAASLRAQAVNDAVVWATGQAEPAELFRAFTPRRLVSNLQTLLNRRLDMLEVADIEGARDQALQQKLVDFVRDEAVAECVAELGSMQSSGELLEDAGENLAGQIEDHLREWGEMVALLEAGELVQAAAALFNLRREHMDLRSGKRESRAKELLAALREAYKHRVHPWLGGESAKDTSPDPELEAEHEAMGSRLLALFERASANYRAALAERHALDFDDLEAGALSLLSLDVIQRGWREKVRSVLVDEYQDTNERQRKIIEALVAGRSGGFFAVGDAQQSIYRFRGADVTVFRQTELDLMEGGGSCIQLDHSFRAHPALLRCIDNVLPGVVGTEHHPQKLFLVPYSQLTADRSSPRDEVKPPYMEIILGFGESADEARPDSAAALVQRLVELREAGEVRSWDDIVLLFRASTGFQHYEDALEVRGIPFVTVAGRGFYERPEIRDLLNILRALAEPWNEAALAGLLRSPAIGVSDVGLYQLRWANGGKRGLREALVGELDELDESDQRCVQRALAFLEEFEPQVDRLTVAELLKAIIDWLDYRAVLGISRARLWRNADKLLEDARASNIVRVGEFLDYLRTLRAVGVREGEAPADAEGAVRLMTVHKAKGLEFEIVVVADASRRVGRSSEPIYLHNEVGLAFEMDRIEGQPLIYRIAGDLDRRESEAEESRLLYVAATRAREKLIINGHASTGWGKWSADGWMKQILDVLEVDLDEIESERGWTDLELPSGEQVGIWSAPDLEVEGEVLETEAVSWPDSDEQALFQPLVVEDIELSDDDIVEEPLRDWSLTGERFRPPEEVFGRIVHEVLRGWRFPDEDGFEPMVEKLALGEGIVHPELRSVTVREVVKLVGRLREHPVWREIESAEERYHEVPYSRKTIKGLVDSGRLDLLYRVNGTWKLVDFKTDVLRDEKAVEAAVERDRPQLARYVEATIDLLGFRPEPAICFLDAVGKALLVKV